MSLTIPIFDIRWKIQSHRAGSRRNRRPVMDRKSCLGVSKCNLCGGKNVDKFCSPNEKFNQNLT